MTRVRRVSINFNNILVKDKKNLRNANEHYFILQVKPLFETPILFITLF